MINERRIKIDLINVDCDKLGATLFVNFSSPLLNKNFLITRQALLEDGVPFVPLMTGTCQEEGLLNVAHLLKEPIR